MAGRGDLPILLNNCKENHQNWMLTHHIDISIFTFRNRCSSNIYLYFNYYVKLQRCFNYSCQVNMSCDMQKVIKHHKLLITNYKGAPNQPFYIVTKTNYLSLKMEEGTRFKRLMDTADRTKPRMVSWSRTMDRKMPKRF